MARRATRQIEKSAARSVPQVVRAKPQKVAPVKAAAKASQKGASALAKPNLEGMTADQKVTALLRDREKLMARLLAAEARVTDMEAREEDLTDRISWALDTLSDLLRLPDAS